MSNKMIALFENPWDKAAIELTRMPAHPSRRILVVEDDAAIRQANARVLTGSGYAVDAVADGVAGWEALRLNDFDLLITDHDLPRLSGLDLAKRVRVARLPLPIILAAEAVPLEELERHPWLQLASTLLKPFSPDQLLATVNAVMGAVDCDRFDSKGRFRRLTKAVCSLELLPPWPNPVSSPHQKPVRHRRSPAMPRIPGNSYLPGRQTWRTSINPP